MNFYLLTSFGTINQDLKHLFLQMYYRKEPFMTYEDLGLVVLHFSKCIKQFECSLSFKNVQYHCVIAIKGSKM
jgi:hypothetical protein